MLTIIDKQEDPMTSPIAKGEMTRADGVTLSVLAGLIFGAAAAYLLFGATHVVRMIAASGSTSINLLTSSEVPAPAHDGQPQLVQGSFTTADVVATGLSDGTRALLAAGTGLGVLTSVVVLGGVAYLIATLSRGRPFARPLPVLALIAGATLAIGSLLAQGLTVLGQMSAADELNPVADDVFVVGGDFNPTLIFVGIVVMALAFVFRAGARLQRDTEGLV
jgi:hypothetical protein